MTEMNEEIDNKSRASVYFKLALREVEPLYATPYGMSSYDRANMNLQLAQTYLMFEILDNLEKRPYG